MSDMRIGMVLQLVDRVTQPLRDVTSRLQGFSRQARAVGDRLQSLAMPGLAGAAGGAAMAAALKGPLGAAVAFEAQMDRVGALLRLSGSQGAAQLAELTAEAERLGDTSAFTATQVADAQGFLAMAGFRQAEILAAMPGLLDVAMAGGIRDLARVADISSNILSGFGLEAHEMTRVGDVLTAVFTSANVDLSMLGESMKYAAPIAKAAGVSIEETAAAMGLLGNAGIQGSMAGTAFRAMLERLAAPTKRGREALEGLGLSTTDSQGNLKNFVVLLGEVAEATKHLGTGDQLRLVTHIFGMEASAGAKVLLGKGKTLVDYVEQVRHSQGLAAQVAEQMRDNAQGALTDLISAADGLQRTIGKPLLDDLRSATEWLTGIVRSATSWAKANPELVRTIGLVTAGIAALLTVVGAAMLALAGLGGAIGLIVSPVAIVGGAIAAAVATIGAGAWALYEHWDAAMAAIPAAWDGVSREFEYLWTRVFNTFRRVGSWVSNWIAGRWRSAADRVARAWDGVAGGLRRVWDVIAGTVRAGWARIAGLVTAGLPDIRWPDLVAAGRSIVDSLAGGVSAGAQRLWDAVVAVLETVRSYLPFSNARQGPLSNLFAAGRALVITIAQGVGDAAGTLYQAVRDLLQQAWDNILSVMAPGRIAAVTWVSALLPPGARVAVLLANRLWLTVLQPALSDAWARGRSLAASLGDLLTAATDGVIAAGDQAHTAVAVWIGGIRWPTLPPIPWAGRGTEVEAVVRRVRDAIDALADVTWPEIGRAGAAALQQLRGLAGQARAAGTQLIQWIGDGVAAGATTLAARVQATVTDLTWDDVVASLRDLSVRMRETWTQMIGTVSGSALVETLADGIREAGAQAWQALAWVLEQVRQYLPFSDAERGPLSGLTASGRAIPQTLAAGIAEGASGLLIVMQAALEPLLEPLRRLAAWVGEHLRAAWNVARGIMVRWAEQSTQWAPFPDLQLWKPQLEWLKGVWEGIGAGMTAASGALDDLKSAGRELWTVLSPLTEAQHLAGMELPGLPEAPSLVGSAHAAALPATGTPKAAGAAAPAAAVAVAAATAPISQFAVQARTGADALKALREQGQYVGEVFGGTLANAVQTITKTIKYVVKVIGWAKDAVVAAVDAFDRLYAAIERLPAVQAVAGWIGGVFGVKQAAAAQLTAEEWRQALDQIGKGSQAAGDGLDRYRDAIRQAQAAGEPATEEMRRYKEAIILAKQQAQGGIGAGSVIGEITSMDEVLGAAIGSMAVLWGVGKIARFVRRFRWAYRSIKGGFGVMKGLGRAALLIGRDIGRLARVAGRGMRAAWHTAVAAGKWAAPKLAAAARWAWPRVAAVARLAGVAMRTAWRGAVSAARWAAPHLLAASRMAWGSIRRGVLAAGTAMRDIPGLASQAGQAMRVMAKPDRGQVMADAWELARQRARKYGGTVRSHIGPAMTDTWKQSKSLRGAIDNVGEALSRLARTKAAAGISSVLVPALTRLKAAVLGKGALAHPLIAVAAAAAALGVAAYQYWDPMRKWVAGFFEGLQAAVEPLSPVFEALAEALNFLSPLLAPVQAAFEALGQATEWVFGLLDGTGIERAQGTAAHQAAGRAVGEAVGAYIQAIIDQFKALGEWIRTWIDDTWSGLADAITAAWEGVGGFFTSLWDGIIKTFKDALSLIQPLIDDVTAVGQALGLISGDEEEADPEKQPVSEPASGRRRLARISHEGAAALPTEGLLAGSNLPGGMSVRDAVRPPGGKLEITVRDGRRTDVRAEPAGDEVWDVNTGMLMVGP